MRSRCSGVIPSKSSCRLTNQNFSTVDYRSPQARSTRCATSACSGPATSAPTTGTLTWNRDS